MKTKLIILFGLLTLFKGYSQSKNFIDQPYVETSARADTLVSPDKIYLTILISEKDSKDKISVEDLENKMAAKLRALGIDLQKNLTLNDLASNYKKYFLKRQDIQKSKSFNLLVNTGELAGKVILALEEIEISNIRLEKTEYSKSDELLLLLKSKAVSNAKNQAIALTKPLNQKLSSAIYISDLQTNISSMLAGRVAGIQLNEVIVSANGYEPIDIDFEKIRFEAVVKVTFKLE